MHFPELLCVLVFATYIDDIRSDSEKPPEGFTEIPPALTMESFEDHVRTVVNHIRRSCLVL